MARNLLKVRIELRTLARHGLTEKFFENLTFLSYIVALNKKNREMKNTTLVLILSLSIFIVSCDDCDSGGDCCNAETSKLEISNYLNNWLPYYSPDSIILMSDNSSQVIFLTDDLLVKDTSYFQGDECPMRPAEIKSGRLVSQTDTLLFDSDNSRSFNVTIDQIQFLIADFPNGRQVYASNQITTVEKIEFATILDSEFQNVIVASADSGDVQKVYFSYGLGLVGIKKNDTIYEIE